MKEFEIIKKFFSKLSVRKSSLNLNDDVFFDKKNNLVISIDTYVEGVHFLNFKNPHHVIKKIIRSSLSDLICKGVKPKYYFISGSGNKKTFSKYNLIQIVKSLKEEQKKYKIFLSGGDTVFSKKLSFTITTVGYKKKIIYRNNAKTLDDIYVTGLIGDSYIGQLVLKKKIKLNNKMKSYFIKKYYHPDLQTKISSKLNNFANTSIDISDGLIDDLNKLINKQKLSYKLNTKQIPISSNLQKLIKNKIIKNKSSIINRGDDYQILFTATPSKSGIIKKTAKSLGIKVSKIGKIHSNMKESTIIDENGNKIRTYFKGYEHQF